VIPLLSGKPAQRLASVGHRVNVDMGSVLCHM